MFLAASKEGDGSKNAELVKGLRAACLARQRLIVRQVFPCVALLLTPFDRLLSLHQALEVGIQSDQPSIFTEMETHLRGTYLSFIRTCDRHLAEVESLLSDPENKHLLLTECKLASGQWLNPLELVERVERTPQDFVDGLRLALQKTPRTETRRYIELASAIASLNRCIVSLETWRQQRSAFRNLQSLVSGLETCSNRVYGAHRRRSFVSLHESVYQPDEEILASSAIRSQENLVLSEESYGSVGVDDLLILSSVVRIGFYCRLLLLLPGQIVVCGVRGPWKNLKLGMSQDAFPQVSDHQWRVLNTFPLVGLTLQCPDDTRSWMMHDQRVLFPDSLSRQRFLAALQECILSSTRNSK